MTRINSAIAMQCLTDEHLLAEHREIKRMPYCLRQSIQSGSIRKVPNTFTLGKGHITFFLDKMKFIYNRYIEIHRAVLSRGFDVQSYASNWDGIQKEYWNDYTPTQQEYELLTERIRQRIMESNKQTWHYFGRPLTKLQAVELLSKNYLT